MIKTVRVSDKGQIAIPQQIRDAIGIEKGDDLVIIQSEGKIMLEKAENLSKKMKDDFKDLLVFNEHALRGVWNNKKDDVWNKYKK